jgi:hypothetical protein
MASGHEYRANRPNTWLLRPMLQSEDSPCQPGAVHTWPKADMTARDSDFGGRADIWLGSPSVYFCSMIQTPFHSSAGGSA